MEQLLPPTLLDLRGKLVEKRCQLSNILKYFSLPEGLERNHLKGKLQDFWGWGGGTQQPSKFRVHLEGRR